MLTDHAWLFGTLRSEPEQHATIGTEQRHGIVLISRRHCDYQGGSVRR